MHLLLVGVAKFSLTNLGIKIRGGLPVLCVRRVFRKNAACPATDRKYFLPLLQHGDPRRYRGVFLKKLKPDVSSSRSSSRITQLGECYEQARQAQGQLCAIYIATNEALSSPLSL